MLFLCIAATIGIADYTNYEDMKHAVCTKVFCILLFQLDVMQCVILLYI